MFPWLIGIRSFSAGTGWWLTFKEETGFIMCRWSSSIANGQFPFCFRFLSRASLFRCFGGISSVTTMEGAQQPRPEFLMKWTCNETKSSQSLWRAVGAQSRVMPSPDAENNYNGLGMGWSAAQHWCCLGYSQESRNEHSLDSSAVVSWMGIYLFKEGP